jgi:dephospho-CoA kinase
MLKIGITGGIGSGKSIICKIFQSLGISVYNADEEAKKLTNSDPFIIQSLKELYGNEIYSPQGEIDKPKFSAFIFNNKKELERVNSIIHPSVRKHFLAWLDFHKQEKYVIKEAAILFESQSNTDLDSVITVYSPPEIRIKRVMMRDKISEEMVRKKIENQMSDEEKLKRSDFVIYNDDRQLVIPQVLTIHRLLLTSAMATAFPVF